MVTQLKGTSKTKKEAGWTFSICKMASKDHGAKGREDQVFLVSAGAEVYPHVCSCDSDTPPHREYRDRGPTVRCLS